MRIEYIILGISWLVTIIGLIIFIPKDKIRHAWLIFFFKQFITWLFGLLVVEFHLIDYPVRLFSHASRTSFTFEFFIYPALCVFFNLYYPEKKSITSQGIHYIIYCSSITLIEVLLKNYTDLILYQKWTWYWTWITLLITFYASHKFYLWFFKKSTNSN